MKILLADDETLARDRMRRLLADSGFSHEIVGEASNGKDALEKISSLEPDVAFLDIEMPELSGLEVALSLSTLKKVPKVIFVTAYDSFAIDAFEANAIDYLVKPVPKERLQKTLAKLSSVSPSPLSSPEVLNTNFRKTGILNRIAIKQGQRYLVLKEHEISALVACDSYVEVYASEKKILADDSLDAFAKRLDSARFYRIHRSSIVNLDFLKELRREGDRKYIAVLDDHYQNEFAVSRECLSALKDRLQL